MRRVAVWGHRLPSWRHCGDQPGDTGGWHTARRPAPACRARHAPKPATTAQLRVGRQTNQYGQRADGERPAAPPRDKRRKSTLDCWRRHRQPASFPYLPPFRLPMMYGAVKWVSIFSYQPCRLRVIVFGATQKASAQGRGDGGTMDAAVDRRRFTMTAHRASKKARVAPIGAHPAPPRPGGPTQTDRRTAPRSQRCLPPGPGGRGRPAPPLSRRCLSMPPRQDGG